MRNKERMIMDIPLCFDFKNLVDTLWNLGYRRLEPTEIKILEMLENDTPISEIEKYRNEEL